jgi:NADH dehydrogenase
MNLVVGATGLLGSEICGLLVEKLRPVRGLVRTTSDPEKVDRLRGLGVELVVGDLKDPVSLERACADVDAVVSTATSTTSRAEGDTIESVDRDGQLALVDACSAAGVKRFVFVSFPEFEVEFPLQSAKRAVEGRIRESGMEFTILSPTNFNEVWLSPRVGFDPLGGEVQIFGAGDRKTSWISVHDVASFTAEAVHSPAARDRTLDLGGPDALSYLEVVRVFEEETGRRIAVTYVPVDALDAQLAEAPDSLAATYAGLMLGTGREGQPIDMDPVLRDFPFELRSVRDYARTLAAAAAQR